MQDDQDHGGGLDIDLDYTGRRNNSEVPLANSGPQDFDAPHPAKAPSVYPTPSPTRSTNRPPPRSIHPSSPPVGAAPRTINLPLILGALAAVLVVIGCIWYLLPEQLPSFPLSTNNQDEILDVQTVTGNRIGVLLYLSPLPGDRHKALLARADRTVAALKDSEKYDIKLVFGTNSIDDAIEETRDLESTVLLDPGKLLAKELDVDYGAIVFFEPGGKIIRQLDEGVLTSDIAVDDHLDVLLNQ